MIRPKTAKRSLLLAVLAAVVRTGMATDHDSARVRRRGETSQRPRSPGRPRRAEADDSPASYYGVPVIHKPHWKWLIVVYFFLGGISAGAYLLAALAGAVDPRGNRTIVRAGRYLSFATLVPSPILLILDLGRPERFYMMLRVLKLRSPMSLGTWALTGFGAFCSFAAAAQAVEDGLLRPPRWLPAAPSRASQAVVVAGTPFALVVAGYTGVLLAATAVPLWTKRALLLGPLFFTSAVSTAASALAIVLAAASHPAPAETQRLERLESVFALAELAALAAWLQGLGGTAHPLIAGRIGRVFRIGVLYLGLVTPLLIRLVGWLGNVERQLALKFLGYVGSLGALAGGLALRYAVVVAGNASADDPRATFDLTAAPPSAAGDPP